MAEELQALLEKINRDGLRKAEETKGQILAAARKEAEAIEAAAKVQAEKLIAEARREAELLQQKSEQALRQAARNVLLELRGELSGRVREAVTGLLQASLDTEATARIIADLCRGYVERNGAESRLEILVPAADLQVLESSVRAKLAENLRENVNLLPGKALSGGFTLRIKGSDVVYDFSDTALAEAIAAHLGPRIVAIIAGAN